MAGSVGPDLVQNGLVLALDAADKNSCGGQPTTNLLTYSNALNNAIWAGYCGPVSNITYNTTDITDPIGTNTAIKIARNNQNGCFTVGDVSMGLHYNPAQNILTVGKTYTVSIYARGASGGESFSYGLNDTHMVDTTLTTTWTRYTTTFTNITNATRGIQFYNSTASSQVYYVWGLQTQEGSVVGPYAASGASNGTANLNWRNLSGNANNGTFVNNPSFSNINGGTIYFDGVANYCAIAPSANFEWTPSGSGLNNVTFDLWVKTSDSTGYLFSKPWNGSGEYNYYAYYNGFYSQIGNQANAFNFSSVATGNWINLVILVSSTQWGAYINGVQNVALTNHGITTNTPSFGNTGAELALMTLYPYGAAAAWPGNTSFSIQGNVGNFKIYNRVLTATEILQNYNAIKTRFML